MATELAIRVLQSLNDASELPLASGEAFPDVESTVLKGALDSLQSREMLVYETLDREEPVLTEEAEGIVRDGSHEAKVYQAVCAAMDGIKISELPVGGPIFSPIFASISNRGRELLAGLLRKLVRGRLSRRDGSRRMVIGCLKRYELPPGANGVCYNI